MNVKKSVFLIFSCILIANTAHGGSVELSFYLTDLLKGQAGSCFTAEQAQTIKKAFDEDRFDQISDFLAPFVQAENAEAITSLAIIEHCRGNNIIANSYLVQAGMHGKYTVALLNLGIVCRVLKKYDDAELTLILAALLDDPRACFELALLFSEKKDTESMKKYLHQGADDMNDPWIMEKLGTYYLAYEKNYALARQYFQKCLDYRSQKSFPTYIDEAGCLGRAWYGLGYTYMRTNAIPTHYDRLKGLSCLHSAADIYGDVEACHLLFVHYYENSNDTTKALSYFEKWIQESSAITSERLHLYAPQLVKLYQNVGNKEQAEKYAQMAKTD